MKTLTKLSGIVMLLFLTFSAFSQDKHVRIGFIGNSITIGTGLSNPTVECYPSQVALLLNKKYGDTCVVQNYAVSGRTMLKHGDFPIWNEPFFKKCRDYAPDICFICLGTNDSKPYNWDVYGTEFMKDYKAMIDTFKLRNPNTKFIVCRPAPAFAVVYDIRNSVIKDGVIPVVDSIAKYAKAELVDFYTPLVDSVALFPDKIHPNARGAQAFARIVYNKIVSSDIIHKVTKGQTFVTSFATSSTNPLRQKDSVVLSWTTINATEAFLNGKKVANNGSIKLAPYATTKYTLAAKGNQNNDSLNLIQNVYAPTLTKLYALVENTTVEQHAATTISFQYYDQTATKMTDTIIEPICTVTQGYGRFINKGENKIDFVADSAGKAKLNFTIGSISKNISLTITAVTTAITNTENKAIVSVFPNPVTQSAYFKISTQKPTEITIKIVNMNGSTCINKKQAITAGDQTIQINTTILAKGLYTYAIELNGKVYSGKLIKE